MSTFKHQYSRLLRKYYDKTARPVWPPSLPGVRLGDYGHVIDEVFVPGGNLADLGVAYSVIEDNDPDALTLITSEESSMSLKFSGETNANLPSVPQGKAGLGFSFGREGAFVLSAEQSFVPRISNLDEVGEAIKQLKTNKQWDTEWRVVTSLVRMPSARFFLSQSSNSAIELTFEGTLTPSISELGKVGTEIKITGSKNAVFHLNPATNITPIVHLHRLKGKIFGDGEFEPFKARALATGTPASVGFSWEPDLAVEIDFSEIR